MEANFGDGSHGFSIAGNGLEKLKTKGVSLERTQIIGGCKCTLALF